MHYSQFPQYHHHRRRHHHRRHHHHHQDHHHHRQWMVIGLATSAVGPNFGFIKQIRPTQKADKLTFFQLKDSPGK